MNRLTAAYLKADTVNRQQVLSTIMRSLYLADVDIECITCLVLAAIQQATELLKNTINIIASPEVKELNDLKTNNFERFDTDEYNYLYNYSLIGMICYIYGQGSERIKRMFNQR